MFSLINKSAHSREQALLFCDRPQIIISYGLLSEASFISICLLQHYAAAYN